MIVATVFGVTGCASVAPPLPQAMGINASLAVPTLEPAPVPPSVPEPPVTPQPDTATSPLSLDEVIATVLQTFPLLAAAEQERLIAAGQRESAEGGFDTMLKSRGTNQEGTFGNSRLDLSIEQALPSHGITAFGGYRFGYGSFPVYYGDRKTADGGELRAGFTVPLLRDGPIDRRRAVLRQAQLGEQLAEPIVRRARIDAVRASRRIYWNWIAAGEQYRISESLLDIAMTRQKVLEDRLKKGADPTWLAAEGRRAVAQRQERLVAAELRFQQASVELSLVYRDAAGNPLLVGPERLPRKFPTQTLIKPEFDIAEVVSVALTNRPEFARFTLQKERLAVDIRLAQNQMQLGLYTGLVAAQDLGVSRTSFRQGGTIFKSDRTNAEVFIAMDLPAQRREARGRLASAQGQLAQLLANERYTRDQITAEVQAITANLERTWERLARTREEATAAREVATITRDLLFKEGQIPLFQVNAFEALEAEARGKVVELQAELERAYAEFQAALGLDLAGGPVVPQIPATPAPAPGVQLPPPRPVPMPPPIP